MYNFSEEQIYRFAQEIVDLTRTKNDIEVQIDELKLYVFDGARGGIQVNGGSVTFAQEHHRTIVDLPKLIGVLQDRLGLQEQEIRDILSEASREVYVSASIAVTLI